jgi:hypothetical protein
MPRVPGSEFNRHRRTELIFYGEKEQNLTTRVVAVLFHIDEDIPVSPIH